MKLRKVFASVVVSVLCSLALGACTDIDDMLVSKGNGEGKILKIEARLGKAQTRVSTSGNWSYNETDSMYDYNENFSWENGDEIALCTSDGTVARYRTENGDGMFTLVSGGLSTSYEGYVRAFYPADAADKYAGVNSSNYFVAETYVNPGEEGIYLEFTSAMSKVILRTYAEGGANPVDIQPVLYGVSSNGYWANDGYWDWGEVNGNWVGKFPGHFEPYEKDSVLFSDISYDYDRHNGYEVRQERKYKSYSGLFIPSDNYTFKYKLYGIYDVEKKIPEKFEAGTLYEVTMKVPQIPTIIRGFEVGNEHAIIDLPLPKGCKLDSINPNDYEVKISTSKNEMWTLPLPEITEDSVLRFRVNYSSHNDRLFSLEIYKKDGKVDKWNSGPVYRADNIGVAGSDKMEGWWEGVETWTDEDGEHTKSYKELNFWDAGGYCTLSHPIGGHFRQGMVWSADDWICMYDYKEDDAGGYYLYWFAGTVDNPVYPTKVVGRISSEYITDHWECKDIHHFEMKRKN